MPEIDLETRFPQMRPVTGLPSLWSINGVGLRLCGHRDEDAETGTYVRTQCFCVLWIPLLALRAFRMANIEHGLLLVGREPLTVFAKTWNLFLVSMCLGATSLVLWNKHIGSPEYIAQSKLEAAERLVAQGNLARAAEQYRRVLVDHPDHAPQATAELKALLQGPVRQAPLEDASKVLPIAIEFQWQSDSAISAADIEECGWALAEKFAESDPSGTLSLLNLVTPLATKRDRLDDFCLRLLVKLVEREPDNPELVSQMAAIHERRGDLEKCAALLKPFQARLGHSEGARILGQIEARQGHADQAVGLLSPFVAEWLSRLHEAEKDYQDAIRMAQEKVVSEIKQQQAPPEFYRKARRASPAEQNEMVRSHVESKLQNNVEIKRGQQRLMAATSVVPVALELGMLRLSRAQAMSDQDARRLELEEAEKTLLAIRGVIGEADEFRVNLGKVYYWLGRPEDGKKLFDELLEKHHRSFPMLANVSHTLFNLGAFAESRTLSEEAYNKAGDETTKHQAAVQRALTPLDDDDQLTWLKRANQADPEIKALLNDALGHRAMVEHRDEDAVKHFRQSLEARSTQVEQIAALNNGALTHFKLFQLTGDKHDYTQGVELLDRAVKLDPSNGILLANTASAALKGALMEVIGDTIDLTILKLTPEFDHLPYLYDDDVGWNQYVEKVRNHPGITQALDYLDRAAVVTPKQLGTYAAMRSIHLNRRNLDALRSLRQRLETVRLDLSDAERVAAEYYSGQRDEKYVNDLASVAERYEELIRTTRNRSSKTTFAVAAGGWLKTRMGQAVLGVELDFDDVVRIAEEAHAGAPSVATRHLLYSSLLYRAGHGLARSQPAFSEMAIRAQRSLGSGSLIAVALTQPGELQGIAAANADVRRAVTLIIEEQNRLTHRGTPWDWAIVQALDADQAARIADKIQHDEFRPVDIALNEKLTPASGLTTFHAFWTCQMEGNPREAAEILRRAAKQGILLPFDPPP
jgi:tetratricopeptide (TPR) repeat protein